MSSIPNHWFCLFYTLRGSVRKDGYIERCKCGKSNVVSIVRRELGKKVEATTTKHWFDREGNLLRVTGNDVILPCNITKSVDNQ